MERVWIRGTSGSGKTTLGRALAARLGVPFVDLDDLYWTPGWTPRLQADFEALVARTVDQPRWVVAGNYTKVRKIVEPKAQVLVWLDYSLAVAFSRVLRRTVRRVATGEPCCNGNREGFRNSFLTRDSVIWWCLTTHARRRRECVAAMAETCAGQARLRFRSPKETRRWIDKL